MFFVLAPLLVEVCSDVTERLGCQDKDIAIDLAMRQADFANAKRGKRALNLERILSSRIECAEAFSQAIAAFVAKRKLTTKSTTADLIEDMEIRLRMLKAEIQQRERKSA